MSLLNDMTAGITGAKATKAAKLTPVKGETSTSIESMAAAILPNDVPGVFMSNEALRLASKDLRDKAALLISVADGLDILVGTEDPAFATAPDAPPKKLKPIEARFEGKEPEPKPDFDAEYAAKSEAAQAATFISRDATTDPASGWVCPTHGASSLSTITPRKGKPYLMCDDDSCENYERNA